MSTRVTFKTNPDIFNYGAQKFKNERGTAKLLLAYILTARGNISCTELIAIT
jgi:hypothetical protein